MTLPDPEALRRVAEAATPGPWFQSGSPWFSTGSVVLAGSPDPHVGLVVTDTEPWEGARAEAQEDNPGIALADPDDDAAFIATFDPPTVLALLDERDAAANRISELEARVGVLEGAMSKIADGKTPPDQHGHYLAHREAVEIARAALQTQEPGHG